MTSAPDYLNPALPSNLKRVEVPILDATPAALEGYGVEPSQADESHQREPERILMWHANYHPDGGQLFFPIDDRPYMVPLALPGDSIAPENFACFRIPGGQGLYIHPNVWHEGIFPIQGSQRFFDKQGAVHARVSVDFAKEFDCLLDIALK